MSPALRGCLHIALIWVVGGLIVLIAFGLAGCATLDQPGPTEIVQQGAANVVTEDVTGISINQALPLGLMPMVGWIMYLSHRREVLRLKGVVRP